MDPLEDIHGIILRTLVDEPQGTFGETGGVVREGFDSELDELRVLSHSGRQALVAIEERERTRTGSGR